MSNLNTRKIVLGLLMTLVLAFSVQGVADALTFTDPSNGGNLGIVGIDQEFSVTFRANVNNPTNILNTSGHRVEQDNSTQRIDSSGYQLTTLIGTTTTYRKSSDADTKTGFRDATAVEKGRKTANGAHVDSNGNVVDSDGTKLYTSTTGSTRVTAEPDDPLTDVIAGGATYKQSSDADNKTGFRDADATEKGRKEADGAHVDSNGNVVDASGNKLYEALTGSTRLKAAPDNPVPVTARFHYNEEAIAISFSSTPTGGNISLTKNQITIPVLLTDPTSRLSGAPDDSRLRCGTDTQAVTDDLQVQLL